MPFENIAKQAIENTPKKVFRRPEEMKNFIDCTGAHAEHSPGFTKIGWEECKFLKKSGSQNFCTEYVCYCTGNKCNKPIK